MEKLFWNTSLQIATHCILRRAEHDDGKEPRRNAPGGDAFVISWVCDCTLSSPFCGFEKCESNKNHNKL